METAQGIDRARLYDEVWAEPMIRVALRYEVSSSYLARVCERLNVPRPPRGYWALLAVGRPPAKPALPEARVGDDLEWSRGGESVRVASTSDAPPSAGVISPRPTKIPRSGKHPLLQEARAHFENAKELDTGYLRPTKKRRVDVVVSKQQLEYALDTTNKLFVALENAGHHITFAHQGVGLHRRALDADGGGPDQNEYASWKPDRATLCYFGRVAVTLTVFETSTEVEMRYLDGKYVPVSEVPPNRRRDPHAWTHKRHVPSGRLCLVVTCSDSRVKWQRQWRETRRGELKSTIDEIISELEASESQLIESIAEAERQTEIQRREWEAQAERWRKEEEERRRAQNLKEGRDELRQIIEAWRVATGIEAFFQDIEQRSLALSGAERAVLTARLNGARALVGGVDALQRFASWKTPEER